MRQRKSEGNRLFNKQKYQEAADRYLEALSGLPSAQAGSNSDDEAGRLLNELEVPCYNNIALCLKNQNRPAQALEVLDIVLKRDPGNQKALVRKLEILLQLNETAKLE